MYCFVDPQWGEAFAKTGASPLARAGQKAEASASGPAAFDAPSSRLSTTSLTPPISFTPGEAVATRIRTTPIKPDRGYTSQDAGARKQTAGDPVCPHCHGPVIRVRRRFIDRVLSLIMPVQRYRCRMKGWGCDWEGNL